MNSLIESIDYNIKSVENLLNKELNFKNKVSTLQVQQKELENKLTFISSAKNKYTVAVNQIYEESIGGLKDTLNTALQYIMFDKNYTANLTLEDKRGTKTLDITLIDNDDDFEVDLKDGVGQGVRTIISFVLKMYYLINKNSHILLLDEKYSALSAHYIPRFFEFMQKMCEEKNFIVVLITHDERFLEYGDKMYSVLDGYVEVINREAVDVSQFINEDE